ncbi:septal ring factor EnvC (AmiA/AmiB activator) [Undibacterium sp. GrIS 1.8]|uniref:DUF4124 domain-containing protein n=1 Tax=unclassified Undibacterium TaxID=2630295 RepID=UPI00339A88D4
MKNYSRKYRIAHLRFLPIIVIMITSISSMNSASAETYKCVKNGATSYSQSPCTDNAQQTTVVHTNTVPESTSQQAAQTSAKEKAEATRLAASRHKAEEKSDREMKVIAGRNEKKKQKCDAAQLKIKWVKEDAKNAKPKAEAKARQNVKRATEKAALVCGPS